MSDYAALLERVKRVRALALRGVGGEQESAAAMLQKLMEKYGFTEADLETEQIEKAWFRYKTPIEEKLLGQVIYMIMGSCPVYSRYRANPKRTHKVTGVECTAAQRLEIEMAFEFYRDALEKEMQLFYRAFVSKNSLFPPPELAGDTAPPEALSREEAIKLSFLMEGMDRHTMRKMIEGATT